MTENNKSGAGSLLGAVLLTVLMGILLAFILYLRAERAYCAEIQPSLDWWLCRKRTSLRDIGLGTVGLKAILPAFLYCFVHPFIGKIITLISSHLGNVIDSIYELDEQHKFGDWTSETSMLAGAGWPITALVIPLSLFAIIIGFLYRSLWK